MFIYSFYQEEVIRIDRRAWAEINLSAIRENFFAIKKGLGKNVKMCCVVKANAYGHGACRLSALYEKLGADMLAVATVFEAKSLREAGIGTDILVLGYTPPEYAALAASLGVIQCVYSLDYARELCTRLCGEKLKIHIKIDTGMGRLGFVFRDTEADIRSVFEIEQVCLMKGLLAEGIFTHLALADGGVDGREFTYMQYSCFLKIAELLSERGISFPIRHLANSAAVFDYPEMALDMVRAGIALYGLLPSASLSCAPELLPAMTLKTVISHIKNVRPGECIGYGGAYAAEGERKIATLPIGYADGVPRLLSGVGKFTVDGICCDTVGKICMDQTMIDITEAENARVGDAVTVFGRGAAMSAEGMAGLCNTIGYEILTGISERVERIYINEP